MFRAWWPDWIRLKSSQVSPWRSCPDERAALRMEGSKMRPAVARLQPLRHCTDDLPMGLGLHHAVAAQNPDQVFLTCVAPPEPLAIDPRVLWREDLRPDAPDLVNFVAPGRKERDDQPARLGLTKNRIDMAKYFSFGCVGSRSIRGTSPLWLGCLSPSNSARATAWITVNPCAARTSRKRRTSASVSRWSSSQAVSASQKNGLPFRARNRWLDVSDHMASGFAAGGPVTFHRKKKSPPRRSAEGKEDRNASLLRGAAAAENRNAGQNREPNQRQRTWLRNGGEARRFGEGVRDG